MWSPARIVGLLLGVVAVAGVVAGLAGGGGGAGAPAQAIPPPPAAASAPAATTASPEPAASVLAPLLPPAAPSAALAASAAAAPLPAPAAPAASPPRDVDPQLGKVALPSLGPIIDERRRAGERARAMAASAASAARVPTAQPAFAVWTRVLRTRAESDQMAEAMRDLLRTSDNTQLRVEVLSVGPDWRVVGWPYADRKQADSARERLAARGLRVDVVEF